MKRYTTKYLKTLALLYLCFPLVYIVSAALLFDLPAKQCVRIMLSPFYWAVCFLAMAVGYGLWEMRRWAWYLFVATNVLIIYGNAVVVGDYSASHHKVLAFAASVLIILVIMYRVGQEVRVPYFFPRIRWWESNPRYRLSVSTQLTPRGGGQLEGQILDISMGGCFVKVRDDLKQDELISLYFSVYGLEIKCDGFVVWRTMSTVTHPKGVGVKFTSLGRQEKRNLRQITRNLKKVASLYRRSRHLLSQEDFLKQLEEIEARKTDHRVGTT